MDSAGKLYISDLGNNRIRRVIEAWASQKSFQRKDRPAPPPDDPGNPTVDFHGETRSNEDAPVTDGPGRTTGAQEWWS